MSLRSLAPDLPATLSAPQAPTSGQERAQPVEVSPGGGPSGSCRLRHCRRGIGRCQGRRRSHHDQATSGDSGANLQITGQDHSRGWQRHGPAAARAGPNDMTPRARDDDV